MKQSNGRGFRQCNSLKTKSRNHHRILFRKTRKTRRPKNAIGFSNLSVRYSLGEHESDENIFQWETARKFGCWYVCGIIVVGESGWGVRNRMTYGVPNSEKTGGQRKKTETEKSPLLILRVFKFHLRVLT